MRLNQATLPATNLSASRAFWERLGFTLIVDAAPRYLRFLAPDGYSTLSLHIEAAPAQGGAAIYFECEDLDARCAALQAAGAAFDTEPADQSWLWREAWLTDPGGTRVCLFWAGENRIDPPWRVKT